MGRRTGIVLMGIGAFALVAAALLRFYAYDRVAVVPLDQDSVSRLAATDATVFDLGEGREITADLETTSNTLGDVEASEEASDELGRKVAIWNNFSFTKKAGEEVTEDNPPLSAGNERVAFDRVTGAAIEEDLECCETYVSGGFDTDTGEEIRDTTTEVVGQVYKLPFQAQQTTYQWWDGTLKAAGDLAYESTEDVRGLETYKYVQVVPPTDVGDLPSAGNALFGVDDPDAVIDRVYSVTRTLWVEPETGVVVDRQEDVRTVAELDGEEVATLTEVTTRFDDATVQDYVDTYSSLSGLLKFVRGWGPVLLLVLGLLLLAGGLVLILRDRRGSDRHAYA